jgi:hypothetical protein
MSIKRRYRDRDRSFIAVKRQHLANFAVDVGPRYR